MLQGDFPPEMIHIDGVYFQKQGSLT